MTEIIAWKSAPIENQRYRFEKIDLRNPSETINSFSQQIPGGVYTTFRTYEGNKVLPLVYQSQRLEDSACLLGKKLHINNEMLRDFIRHALEPYQQVDARLRLSVDLDREPGTLYLAIEPLKTLPQSEYDRGVWVVTRSLNRYKPGSKQISFISVQEEILAGMPEGAHEALLVDDSGCILEGLSSNFFAVKDGEIQTAGCSVLPGITRSLVLDAARREMLSVNLKCISIKELATLQEAFITSSSRSILPIRQVDDTQIGTGNLGPLTKRLARAYRHEVRAQLESV